MSDLERKAREIAKEFVDEYVTEEGYQAILKALADVREADAKVCKDLARKHADKIIGEDTEEAEIQRKAEAWMMLQCSAAILEQGVK